MADYDQTQRAKWIRNKVREELRQMLRLLDEPEIEATVADDPQFFAAVYELATALVERLEELAAAS